VSEQRSLFGVRGLTSLGWDVPDDMTRDEWIESMATVQIAENLGPWAIADGMIAGLMQYGDEAWQGLNIGYEEKTVNRMIATAEDFPIARRRDGVSLWKAEIMRGLPEELQDNLMTAASLEGLTVDMIRERVEAYEGKDQAEMIHDRECPLCRSRSEFWHVDPATVPDELPEGVGVE
jgi:hypothetical protein